MHTYFAQQHSYDHYHYHYKFLKEGLHKRLKACTLPEGASQNTQIQLQAEDTSWPLIQLHTQLHTCIQNNTLQSTKTHRIIKKIQVQKRKCHGKFLLKWVQLVVPDKISGGIEFHSRGEATKKDEETRFRVKGCDQSRVARPSSPRRLSIGDYKQSISAWANRVWPRETRV